MECPNCGNDQQQVFVKPVRFKDHDIRTAQCRQCGVQMEIISTIKGLYVFNPVTEEREFVSFTRFVSEDFRAVTRGHKPHPAQVAFEREHGDD